MHYFCINDTLYRMTEKNFKRLCKKYPMKKYPNDYETEQSYIHKIGQATRFDEGSTHEECLDWIIDNSKLVNQVVHVHNY